MPGTSEESGEPATFAGAAPSKQPPREQAQKTSGIEEWSAEALSEPAMHNVYQEKLKLFEIIKALNNENYAFKTYKVSTENKTTKIWDIWLKCLKDIYQIWSSTEPAQWDIPLPNSCLHRGRFQDFHWPSKHQGSEQRSLGLWS